jgi:hypothetical protein
VPAILILLKSLSPKTWLHIAFAVAVLSAAAWIYHKGEQHDAAATTKLAQAAIVHDTEVQNVVKSKLADALKDYELAPVVPVATHIPSIVCYSSGGSTVPGGRGPASASDGAGAAVPSAPAAADAGFDPAPAISRDGLIADTEILRLKAKVTLLQQMVSAYQDAGLVARK